MATLAETVFPPKLHPRPEMLGDAVVVVDPALRIQFWNGGAQRLLGHTPAAARDCEWPALVAPGSAEPMLQARDEALANGQWQGEMQLLHRDGHCVQAWCRWECEPVSGATGVAPAIMITSTDLRTWRLDAEGRAQVQNRRNFSALFWQHPDGVFSLSRQGKVLAVNPALSLLTGCSIEELMSQPGTHLVARADFPAVRRAFRLALDGVPQTCDFCCVKPDGSRVDVQMTLLPQISEDCIVGLHGIVRDASQRRSDEQRILYLANHDAMTGLPNRNLLHDRMQHAIGNAHRHQTGLGVLFMDLNRFKVINDSLGHEKGDQLLRVVADRLCKAVGEADTVARLGGDEFVVLMEHAQDAQQVRHFAQMLLAAVNKPIDLDCQSVSMSTSIGAAMYPDDGIDAGTLLKHADLAMYAAKEAGLGQFRFYEAEMDVRALSQLWREHSLRRAIAEGELVLHYQPRLDLATNRLVGVEALVRWAHPERGLIFPNSFIELAEEIGIIGPLGSWVLQSACRQLRSWRDIGLHSLKVSINVSPMQLHAGGFGEEVSLALAQSGLEPDCLELEITENSLVQNIESMTVQLASLRRLGVSVSIDDFGTGYSSLSYLKRLPVDTLKIDKSFVRDIPGDPDDSAIVAATIALAHSMQLRVVAEGVTSFEQAWMLQSQGCDEIQGYLLCQPLPAAQMENYFRASTQRGIQYAWERH